MRKKIILSLIFLFAITLSFAQKNVTNLISDNGAETVITFNVEDYNLKTVATDNGEAVVLTAPESSQLLIKDAPDLAKFTASIIIPDYANMQVEVVSSKFIELDEEINIAPSKGNLTRDIDPATVPYTFGKIYQKDAFYPGQLADMSQPYIARDFRGQAVHVYPFQYNPVTKKLRIYTEITVKITPTGSIGVNVFERTKNTETIDREFNEIYKHQFINYSKDRYDPVLEEGNMLVICYGDWTDEMQPLVDWKNTIGRPCEMVTVTEAGGSSSAIATYVENYYNDNGLTYLLLVGDAAQVPTNSGGGLGGDSDNAYAYITGSDHYLEFFVGRFSAESAADVETQVLRTIEYENGSELPTGWLNVTMGVTSDQGPGDDNEMDYEHYRNLATDLLAFTYVTSLELFDGSQGGNDASGNPTPTMVGSDINNGVGIINYTGHGSDVSWGSSGYSVSDINNLTNDKMLPFIWSVACVNGNFVGQTCFGEAWLRATNGNEPTGAIAIMASTINQSWAPPMNAQDEMVDLLVGISTNGTKRTFAGLSINGCHLMNDEDGDFAMTDTWTCFGDPSLLVRTDDPAEMTITHDDVILFGTSTFSVNTGYENTFACISKDGQIIGTATGATAEVPLDGLNPGDEITLAVTGFNKITYLTTLTVIAPEGPFIVVGEATINGVTSLDYGQTGNFDITLTNVGPEIADGVTATLTTTDEYVTSLTNNEDVSFGDITGDNGTATSSGSFTVTLADNVPDEYIITFNIAVNSTNKTLWENQINLTANAPVLSINFEEISDATGELTFTSTPNTEVDEGGNYNYDIDVLANGGNDNGLLDPGEVAGITVNTCNTGHADLVDATCILTSTSEYVTVNTGEVYLGTIAVAAELPTVFSISIDEGCPIGESVELIFTLVGGEYNEELIINLPVGLQIEDFESGDFNSYDWTMGGNADWIISSDAYEGTNSAQSGIIDHNQTTELSMTCNVTADGQISFWSKVSTEEGWDKLFFYIDGNEQEELSGVIGWTEYTYNVTAGSHTFKWIYDKDGSDMGSGYTDEVWVDFITFPGHTAAKGDKALTITAPTLPTWLTLIDNGDGTANLNGTAPNEASTHDVVLEVSDGGTNTETQEFAIQVGQTNILSQKGMVKFYPNPTTNFINIEVPTVTENAQVVITDLAGKLILAQTINSNNTTIDFSNQAKGIYILKLTLGSETITQKISVK